MDIIKIFNEMVKQSAQRGIETRVRDEHNQWKHCVALAKLGWESYDFEAIPSATENEVIIKWRKEGKEEIHLTLGFTDQRLWIRYMQEQEEKRNAENKKDK